MSLKTFRRENRLTSSHNDNIQPTELQPVMTTESNNANGEYKRRRERLCEHRVTASRTIVDWTVENFNKIIVGTKGIRGTKKCSNNFL